MSDSHESGKADSREAAKDAKKSDGEEKFRVLASSREPDAADGTGRIHACDAGKGTSEKQHAREAAKDAKKSKSSDHLRVFAASREVDAMDGPPQRIEREAAKDAKMNVDGKTLRGFAPSREIKTDGVHEPRDVERLSAIVVDCAYKLHVEVGPGLMESVYEAVLTRLIEKRGIAVRRQVALPFQLMDMKFNEGFRLDLLVDECLVVELKSVERTLPVHAKQLLTYLRLSDLPLGLLINFGAPTFREGIKRIVNRHVDFASSRLRVNRDSMTEGSA